MATLYLFVGYPGSGKTTVANYICDLTSAVHLWADRERQEMFGDPAHTLTESNTLYSYLNGKTLELLKSGKSVVFDTNFNYRKDRDHLRSIAEETGSQLLIIRMTTPVELARKRALHDAHAERNGMHETMSPETFQRIVDHFEPLVNEPHLELDGTNVSKETIRELLGL
jgi:predicted kinase